ncbi:MAG: hypothetical protein KDA59_22950, partial [Planctomycetales bacterium]|nr:hypothetical protein [Planctomycetales bacterium]
MTWIAFYIARRASIAFITLLMTAPVTGTEPCTDLAATLQIEPRSVMVGDPLFARVLVENSGRERIVYPRTVMTAEYGTVTYEVKAADTDNFKPLGLTGCLIANAPTLSLVAGDSYATFDVLPPIRTRSHFREAGEYHIRAILRLGDCELTTAAVSIHVGNREELLELTKWQWTLISAAINAKGVAGAGPIPKEIVEVSRLVPDGHLSTHLDMTVLLWQFRNERDDVMLRQLIERIDQARKLFPPIIQETYHILLADCYMGMHRWDEALIELDALRHRTYTTDIMRRECEYRMANQDL